MPHHLVHLMPGDAIILVSYLWNPVLHPLGIKRCLLAQCCFLQISSYTAR